MIIVSSLSYYLPITGEDNYVHAIHKSINVMWNANNNLIVSTILTKYS